MKKRVVFLSNSSFTSFIPGFIPCDFRYLLLPSFILFDFRSCLHSLSLSLFLLHLTLSCCVVVFFVFDLLLSFSLFFILICSSLSSSYFLLPTLLIWSSFSLWFPFLSWCVLSSNWDSSSAFDVHAFIHSSCSGFSRLLLPSCLIFSLPLSLSRLILAFIFRREGMNLFILLIIISFFDSQQDVV